MDRWIDRCIYIGSYQHIHTHTIQFIYFTSHITVLLSLNTGVSNIYNQYIVKEEIGDVEQLALVLFFAMYRFY